MDINPDPCPDQKAALERVEQEDAGHESPGITLKQIQQDIDKEMAVMDAVLPESVTEQQAQFERLNGPAGDAGAAGTPAGDEQKPQGQ